MQKSRNEQWPRGTTERRRTGNKSQENFAVLKYIKLLVAGLMMLALIQVAVVIIIIYLGIRIMNLSSDVDDIKNRGHTKATTNDHYN